MTVLQGKEARGWDLGQLGKVFGSMLAVGLVAALVVFAVNQGGAEPTLSAYERAGQVRGQAADAYYEAQRLEQANELNKADIGVQAPAIQAGTHVPGAAWSTSSATPAAGESNGVDISDRIEGYPSESPAPAPAPESQPNSRTFGTQIAK